MYLDYSARIDVATLAPVRLISFPAVKYAGMKIVIFVRSGINVQLSEVLLMHNNIDTFLTTYGEVDSSGSMGELVANMSAGYVSLYFIANDLTPKVVSVMSSAFEA